MTAQRFKIRFSACYALLMIGSGVQLPFLPLWLHAKGLAVSEIASVVAGMMAIRVLGAPLFAWAADRSGNRRVVIQACAVVALVAYMVLPFADGYMQIMLVSLWGAFFFAPVNPLIEGFGVDASAALGLDFGRLRLWASLSFLMGSLIGGALLTQLSPLQTVWIIADAQVFSVIATFMLPLDPERHIAKQHAGALEYGAALKFLFGSHFTLFLLAASLENASHGMLYSVSSVYWTSLGFNTFAIGVLWTASIIGEVTFFGFSQKIVQRLGVERLLLVGLAGGIVRWLGTGFATNEYIMFVLQSLHGISFACAHLALMHFIRAHVPAHLRNTAQGLYAALAGGVLLSSVTWMSGRLYTSFGGLSFIAMALISGLGLVIALAYMRFNPRDPQVAAA
ncbi:MAG: MFS transporter [Alphaproteobacteria bacterium]|nr:MFS transporter [Alphaproteobacteria bacterium]